jgi:hypothetical protein
VVVHAAAALRLLQVGKSVGVFENSNRAEIGQPPQFDTTSLHIFHPFDDLFTDYLHPQPICRQVCYVG